VSTRPSTKGGDETARGIFDSHPVQFTTHHRHVGAPRLASRVNLSHHTPRVSLPPILHTVPSDILLLSPLRWWTTRDARSYSARTCPLPPSVQSFGDSSCARGLFRCSSLESALFVRSNLPSRPSSTSFEGPRSSNASGSWTMQQISLQNAFQPARISRDLFVL
jgi:hypothetical protein